MSFTRFNKYKYKNNYQFIYYFNEKMNSFININLERNIIIAI